MSVDFIVIHGAPGLGKTTLATKLHKHLKSPYFEFGWIPEFRMLNPYTEISPDDEEQLSFENLIMVSKNYLRYGFQNVIITDLSDAKVSEIPSVLKGYNFVILTLYCNDSKVIKERVLTRDNGNEFKDWKAAININKQISERGVLPNEYRILNDTDELENILQKMIITVENHVFEVNH